MTTNVDEALIPLDIIRDQLGISRVTLWRRMKLHNIDAINYPGGKALRWADVVVILKSSP